jgi:ferric-dicitrate binding protein FerR (iron transport regulator)
MGGRYRKQEAPEAAAPVEQLEPKRRRERTIDALLWLAAAVSVVGLLWAVGSHTGLL